MNGLAKQNQLKSSKFSFLQLEKKRNSELKVYKAKSIKMVKVTLLHSSLQSNSNIHPKDYLYDLEYNCCHCTTENSWYASVKKKVKWLLVIFHKKFLRDIILIDSQVSILFPMAGRV